MRVVLVTSWFPTTVAPSSGVFVVKDGLAIQNQGHDVDIVHLVPAHQDDGVRHTYVQGLKVLRIPMTPARPWTIARAAKHLGQALQGADIVHTCAISALLPFATLTPDIPWVHTEHFSGLTNPDTRTASVKMAMPAVEKLLVKPDVVTAVVDYLAEPIRTIRGHRPTIVVPCVVPPLGRVPDRPARPEGQRPWTDQTRGLNLVTVGGLLERKDPLLVVDTVAELRRRGVRTTATLVGDGPLAGQVRQRAHSAGVDDAITLTGTLPRPQVLEQLEAADMALLPTRGENFLVACAEAVSSGRPVVAGANGGHGEYLHPAVGRLVETQTAQAYADAVEDLDHHAQDYSASGIAATIGDRFSEVNVGIGYEGSYDLAKSVSLR